MSREIKFRGKSKETGQWVYGSLVQVSNAGSLAIATLDDKGHLKLQEIIKGTEGQYTGLKERNGQEIFEKDIVRHTVGWKGKVQYFEGTFEIEAKHQSWPINYTRSGKIEVVGNIHDNPELLGGEAVKA